MGAQFPSCARAGGRCGSCGDWPLPKPIAHERVLTEHLAARSRQVHATALPSPSPVSPFVAIDVLPDHRLCSFCLVLPNARFTSPCVATAGPSESQHDGVVWQPFLPRPEADTCRHHSPVLPLVVLAGSRLVSPGLHPAPQSTPRGGCIRGRVWGETAPGHPSVPPLLRTIATWREGRLSTSPRIPRRYASLDRSAYWDVLETSGDRFDRCRGRGLAERLHVPRRHTLFFGRNLRTWNSESDPGVPANAGHACPRVPAPTNPPC